MLGIQKFNASASIAINAYTFTLGAGGSGATKRITITRPAMDPPNAGVSRRGKQL